MQSGKGCLTKRREEREEKETCPYLPTHDEASTDVGGYVLGREDGGGGCLGAHS